MPLVVCDTSCLITLERIDRLALVPSVFPDVVAPPAVIREFGRPLDWLPVREVEDTRLAASLRTQLDAGEADVLALTMEQEGTAVLVDEKKARRVAKELELRVVGTLGLLLRAKGQDLVPAVRPLMDALIDADFRISDALYREVLRQADEEAS